MLASLIRSRCRTYDPPDYKQVEAGTPSIKAEVQHLAKEPQEVPNGISLYKDFSVFFVVPADLPNAGQSDPVQMVDPRPTRD